MVFGYLGGFEEIYAQRGGDGLVHMEWIRKSEEQDTGNGRAGRLYGAGRERKGRIDVDVFSTRPSRCTTSLKVLIPEGYDRFHVM